MATVGSVIINLALNSVGLSAGLAKAEADLKAFQMSAAAGTAAPAAGLKSFALAGVLVGATLLGIGASSVKMAAQYEYSMAQIQTQTGATSAEVRNMSEAILQLAPTVQAGPEELARALYHVESVGLRGARGLDVLRVAAEGAAVGGADLEDVTNALVASVISGIKGVSNMSQAMGILNGIVGTGNIRMEDLSRSLSSGVLSTARQFGLSIQDVGAAIATMADQGIPAEEAATRLRITIALLGAPTKIAGKELASIGLTERAIADEMRGPNGLIGALRLLKTHMDAAGLDATEQSLLLKTAFGGSRSSSGLLTLINSLDLMDRKLVSINEKSASFGQDFADESKTAAAQFANFSAAVDVLRVRLGNALLPILIPIVNLLGELAKHTEIIVPLFLALASAIAAMAIKSLIGLAVQVAKTILSFVAMGVSLAGNIAAMMGAAGAATATAGAYAAMGAAATAAGAQVAAANVAMTVSSAAAGIGGAGRRLGALENMANQTASPNEAIIAQQMLARLRARLAAGAPTVAAGLTTAVEDGAMLALPAAAGAGTAGGTGFVGGIITAITSAPVAVLAAIALLIASIVAFDWPNKLAAVAGDIIHGLIQGLLNGIANLAHWVGDLFSSGPAREAAIKAGMDMGKAILEGANRLNPLDWINTFTAHITGNLSGGETRRLADEMDGIRKSLGSDFDSVKDNLASVLDGLNPQDFLRKMDEITQGMSDAFARGGHAAVVEYVKNVQKGFQDAAPEAAAAGHDASQGYVDGAAGGVDATALNQTLIQIWGTSMAGVQGAAASAGAADMEKYAKAILDAQKDPIDAFKTLQTVLKDTLTPTEEIARLVGEMTSKELAAGLASGDPAVVAAAEALRISITERLDEITNGAYSAATQGATQALTDKLNQARANLANGSFVDFPKNSALVIQILEEIAKSRELADEWNDHLAPSAKSAASAVELLREDIAGAKSVSQQAADIVARFGNNLAAIKEVGEHGGAELMSAIAKGIQDGRAAVNASLSTLHTDLKNAMDKGRQIAYLMAALEGDDIAKGLASSDPMIYAAAVAARNTILEQLNSLTEGAAEAGDKTGMAFRINYLKQMLQMLDDPAYAALFPDADAMKMKMMEELSKLASDMEVYKKSLSLGDIDIGQGQKDYLEWLKSLDTNAKNAGTSLRNMASDATSAITSAFDAIKAKADQYFGDLHDKNLQAIKDAHDHAEALLDAKEKLEQKPIDAAQRALDFRRSQEEEKRLRDAIQNATDPASRAEAVRALEDFLMQRHIDDMQDEADKAKEKLEKEKKANDKLYQQQVDAENKRYEQQKKDFDRQLGQLERFLKHHPEMWATAQEKVLGLLAQYGASYANVGGLLGHNFADGIRKQIAKLVADLKKLNDSTPDPKDPGDSKKPPPGYYAMGNWNTHDEMARIHSGEMIIPSSAASMLRGMMPHGNFGAIPTLVHQGLLAAKMAGTSMVNPGILGAGDPPNARMRDLFRDMSQSSNARVGPGGTLIVQIGSEKIAEITDKSLYVHDAHYAGEHRVLNGSVR